MATTTNETAARYTLTVDARGFDAPIVRPFDKVSAAVEACKGAATHPSCIDARITDRSGNTVYRTRWEG